MYRILWRNGTAGKREGGFLTGRKKGGTRHFKSAAWLFLLSALLPVLSAAPFDWEKARELYPGVKLLHREETVPRLLKADCIRIDLKTPGIRFYATGRAEGYGRPMPDEKKYTICTERVRTADFLMAHRAKKINMLVAANGCPWAPWKKPWDFRYGQLGGLNIGGGQIVSDRKQHAVFVVWKDGGVEITDHVDQADYSRIEIAVSGFSILLRNGAMHPGGGYEKELHPRMAYGLSRDRRYLYLLTIDGRQKGWSLGASGPETAQFLLDAGAADGINMDGGGSATLCYFDGRQTVMVNRHKGGGVRKVASNIGIAFEHGQNKPQNR